MLSKSRHVIKKLKKDKEVFTEAKCFANIKDHLPEEDDMYNLPDEDWPKIFEPETVDLSVEIIDLTHLEDVREGSDEDADDDEDTETECDSLK